MPELHTERVTEFAINLLHITCVSMVSGCGVQVGIQLTEVQVGIQLTEIGFLLHQSLC